MVAVSAKKRENIPLLSKMVLLVYRTSAKRADPKRNASAPCWQS